MNAASKFDSFLLDAATRSLREEGYTVIVEPGASLLPEPLARLKPDAIAVGKTPNLVVEIAAESPSSAAKVQALQEELRNFPDWKLRLVVSRTTNGQELATISDGEISDLLQRMLEIGEMDPRAALLMGWAALEALSRQRKPEEFSRPQSPGRIVESFASQGIVTPTEAAFLRRMASKRNAFIHGDLRQDVTVEDVRQLGNAINSLIKSPYLQKSPELGDVSG